MNLHTLCVVLIRTGFSKSTSRPSMFRRFGITSASWNSFYLKHTPLPSLTTALVSVFSLYINTGQHSHPQSSHKRIWFHSCTEQKETPPSCNLHEHLLPFKRISGSLKDPWQKQNATCNHSLHYSLVAKTST